MSSFTVSLTACGGAAGRNEDPAPVPASGVMEHGMENCPSAVAGARTSLRDIDGGVAMEITAAAPDATAHIRELAALHGQMGAPRSAEHVQHTGDHGGPGTIGHCPIIHVGTQVTVVPIDGGVRVTVRAIDAAAVDGLRADIRARVAALVVR
jgi:hypothetical protein